MLLLALSTTAARGQDPEQDEPPELPPVTVVGEPDPFPANPLGEDTVVTPTRTEIPAGRSGSSLTVITREQIEQSGHTEVLDVLRDVPGLDVVQQGPSGGLTSVFMRGGNSQHTKVLLDGIPLNDPSNATRGFDFSTLMVDNIERVEVLRGPQSTLYGSDAIGGVINIITRRGEGPLTVGTRVMGGSYGTGQGALSASGGTPLYHYSFGASYFDSDGFSAAAEQLGNVEDDGFRNGTLSGRYGWTPSDNFDIDYVFRFADATAEVDDFDFFTGLPIDNLIRENLSETLYNRVQVRFAPLDGLIENNLGFNLADYEREDTDSGPFVPPLFLGQTRKADWQTNFNLAEAHVATVGVDYYHEEAESTFDPLQSQYYSSLYVQDQIGFFDRWFTTVGYRWDDHSAAGSAETYRATSIFHVYETGTAIRGTIGTGFRAPALAENFFAFGNPDLRPERSKGWDYGFDQWIVPERFMVAATYFRNDFTDLIVFDFNTFSLQNVGQAKSHGVELSLLWRLNPVTDLTANYTRTDTLDLDTGEPLLRRPKDKASLGLRRRFLRNRARAGMDLLFVGDRLDTGGRTLDNYLVVNLNGGLQLTRGCELFGRVDNLFDEFYEEVAGYGVPGASAYGGLNLVW